MGEKRKVIVGIFAHPDDEAFGPGGTLAKFAKENDVYIICATSGESASGTYDESLGKQRQEELQRSAHDLGVKKVFFLGYKDGTLCNNIYQEVSQEVKKILLELKPDILLTYETHGVSGHIDHIFMSMVTHFLFPQIPSATKLMQHAMLYERSQLMRGKYFIYFPEGYKREEIDEVVDISDVWETKVKAMQEHQSQIGDITRILEQTKNFPKEEYFLVEEKSG